MLIREDDQGLWVKIEPAKRCRTGATIVQFGLQKCGKIGKSGGNLIMNIIVLPDMQNQDRVEQQILANEKGLEGN